MIKSDRGMPRQKSLSHKHVPLDSHDDPQAHNKQEKNHQLLTRVHSHDQKLNAEHHKSVSHINKFIYDEETKQIKQSSSNILCSQPNRMIKNRRLPGQ